MLLGRLTSDRYEERELEPSWNGRKGWVEVVKPGFDGVTQTRSEPMPLDGKWVYTVADKSPETIAAEAAEDLAGRVSAAYLERENRYASEAHKLNQDWQYDREKNRAQQNVSRQKWLDKVEEIKAQVPIPTE